MAAMRNNDNDLGGGLLGVNIVKGIIDFTCGLQAVCLYEIMTDSVPDTLR